MVGMPKCQFFLAAIMGDSGYAHSEPAWPLNASLREAHNCYVRSNQGVEIAALRTQLSFYVDYYHRHQHDIAKRSCTSKGLLPGSDDVGPDHGSNLFDTVHNLRFALRLSEERVASLKKARAEAEEVASRTKQDLLAEVELVSDENDRLVDQVTSLKRQVRRLEGEIELSRERASCAEQVGWESSAILLQTAEAAGRAAIEGVLLGEIVSIAFRMHRGRKHIIPSDAYPFTLDAVITHCRSPLLPSLANYIEAQRLYFTKCLRLQPTSPQSASLSEHLKASPTVDARRRILATMKTDEDKHAELMLSDVLYFNELRRRGHLSASAEPPKDTHHVSVSRVDMTRSPPPRVSRAADASTPEVGRSQVPTGLPLSRSPTSHSPQIHIRDLRAEATMIAGLEAAQAARDARWGSLSVTRIMDEVNGCELEIRERLSLARAEEAIEGSLRRYRDHLVALEGDSNDAPPEATETEEERQGRIRQEEEDERLRENLFERVAKAKNELLVLERIARETGDATMKKRFQRQMRAMHNYLLEDEFATGVSVVLEQEKQAAAATQREGSERREDRTGTSLDGLSATGSRRNSVATSTAVVHKRPFVLSASDVKKFEGADVSSAASSPPSPKGSISRRVKGSSPKRGSSRTRRRDDSGANTSPTTPLTATQGDDASVVVSASPSGSMSTSHTRVKALLREAQDELQRESSRLRSHSFAREDDVTPNNPSSDGPLDHLSAIQVFSE